MNFKKYHVSKNLLDIDRIRSDIFTLDTVYYLNGVAFDTLSMNPSTTTAQIHDNAITIQASSYYGVGFVVPVENGKTYYLTFDCDTSVSSFGGITQLTENGSIQKYSIIYYNSASVSITSADTRYILIVLRCINKIAIFSNIMLNTGSQPLPYEPYSSEVLHDIPHYIHKTDTDTFTTLPADVYADGTNATVGLVGNMVQTGVPTPTTPIQPQECGDLETIGEHTGQYKIPILSNSTTTPVYLGEVESTRRIKKLMLTGQEEGWTIGTASGHQRATITLPVQVGEYNNGYCTHYKFVYAVENGNAYIASNFNMLAIIDDTNAVDKTTFLAYLAAQYAAGTPVTVWYILATETTGIVNEPLRKIGDYADEVSDITIPTIAGANAIDVDTTLKPSEVSVNYHGWHPVQSVHERENGAWT